jgi:hypothetical protein
MQAISEYGVQIILTATVFLRLLLNARIRRIFGEVNFIRIPKRFIKY